MAGYRHVTTRQPRDGLFRDIAVDVINGQVVTTGFDGGRPYTIGRLSMTDAEKEALVAKLRPTAPPTPVPTPPAEPPPTPVPARSRLGVYEGAGAASRVQGFASWLGEPVTLALDFLAFDSWSAIENPAWLYNGWRSSGIEVVLTVPMLPASGATLAQGAQGAYDGHWTRLARNLSLADQKGAMLRLGWEMNGNWYPWSLAKGTPTDYATYWRRIVTAMRNVLPSLRFDFCANNGSSQGLRPDAAYPGDEYVDVIGMDVYDQSWIPRTEWASAANRWIDLREKPYGLRWHRTFAAQHDKPVSFPEWGVAIRSDGAGGGDAPDFISLMHGWIAESNCAYHCYFDFDAPDGQHALRNGRFPKSAARFRELLG